MRCAVSCITGWITLCRIEKKQIAERYGRKSEFPAFEKKVYRSFV